MLINFGTGYVRQKDSIAKIIHGLCSPSEKYDKIAVYIDDERDQPFEFEGVSVVPFRENKFINRVANKWFRLGAFTWQDLVDKINHYRPDILHFQNKQWLIRPILKRLKYKPKVVVHYHLFGETIIPQGTDMCVVVSQMMVGYFNKTNLLDAPVSVLYNFVPESMAQAGVEPPFNRLPKIFYGGGLGKHKGINQLIAAASSLDGNFQLQLAGRLPEGFSVTDTRIKPLGLLSSEQYLSAIQSSDIVVMPSWLEPFGMIALETLAMGRLLVHTGVDGLAEFAKEDCSLWVKPKDVDSLREGLERAIQIVSEDPDQYHQLTTVGKARAAEFSLSRAVVELERIYDSLFEQ